MTRIQLQLILDALRIGADYVDGAQERYALEVFRRERYPSDSVETQFDQQSALMTLAIETARQALSQADADPWHVGELSGDDGRTIRDENGLTVCMALSAEAARALVADHNREFA